MLALSAMIYFELGNAYRPCFPYGNYEFRNIFYAALAIPVGRASQQRLSIWTGSLLSNDYEALAESLANFSE